MNIKPVFRAAVIVAATLFGTSSVADVTLGSSSNPAVALDERLSSLFGAERRTLSSLGSSDLNGLVHAPEERDVSMADKMTKKYLDTLPVATGGDSWSCLSEALYFEARGERIKGIFGVAEVILNRVDDPRYPDTVCAVVNQGTGERYRCQFTYTCDGQPETIREPRAFQKVAKVARIMLDGAPRTLTNGATHYHTKSVSPNWSNVFPRTTTIGYHHFYREPSRNAQS